MDWTERLDELRDLAAEGLTAAQIGERMGTGKNAVIGACHRHDVQLTKTQGGRPGSGRPRKTRPTAVIAALKSRMRVHFPPEPIAKERLEPPTELPFLCVELLDLKPEQCRYPHGEDKITFCGQPKDGTSSYCAFHHSIALYRKREAFVPRAGRMALLLGHQSLKNIFAA